MASPEPRRLHFSKMHGAGNDFVVLDLREDAALAATLARGAPEFCRALADRHTGVGCDQILTIDAPRSAGALASYGIWNADGSPSRQCGNGARCVAAWLIRDGVAGSEGFVLDSPAGTHAVDVLGDSRLDQGMIRIAMGVPQFAPSQVPLTGHDQAQDDYVLATELGEVRFGAVSMGNPHLVIKVDDVADAPVAQLGPRLQGDAMFPQSANVGFVQIIDRGHILLRVHERGAGETLACGSGACAAVAVLARRGCVDRDVMVSLPGGDLHITWPDDDAQLLMSGPAAFVFDGEWQGMQPNVGQGV